MICRCLDAWLDVLSSAGWWIPRLALLGTALQLVGSVLTLWSLLSAPLGLSSRLEALVGALWRSESSRVAASLAELNPPVPIRVLQGVAVLALGYLLELVSQVWWMILGAG